MRRYTTLLFLTMLCCFVARSQRAPVDSLVQAAENAFNNAMYENAELIARRLLESPGLPDTLRIACERLIGSSLIAQGKPSLAKEHFSVMLKIDPTFEFDPVITSPKILSVFTETKREFVASRRFDSTLVARAPATGSALSYRAILFPGWEQLHTDRSTMGTALLSLGALSLGSGIAAEFLRSSSRRDYLAATTPSDIADKYKIYNRYYRAESFAFIVFAATYAASEIDLFTSDTHSVQIHAAMGDHNSSQIVFSLRF